MAKKKSATADMPVLVDPPKSKLNKSELIRTTLAANPTLGVTEISELINRTNEGIKMTPAMVSQIKSKMNKGNSTSAGKKTKLAKKSEVAPGMSLATAMKALDIADELFKQCGSWQDVEIVIDKVGKMKGFTKPQPAAAAEANG